MVKVVPRQVVTTIKKPAAGKNITSFRIRTKFQIGLHRNEEKIINKIKEYFQGVGVIYKDQKNNKITYTVYKKEDITNVIIPHFSKYPLQSRKRISYEYWCKIHNNILEKDYYDDQTKLIQYLKDLPKINSRPISKILLSKPRRGGMVLLYKTTPLSPEIIKVISEDREDSSSLNTAPNSLSCLNPNWVAGFTAGEGHFGVVISKREGRNPEVKLRFIITQKSDKILLERIRMTINCGKLSIRKMGEIYDLRVQDLDNIINKIIPFFLPWIFTFKFETIRL